MPARKRGRKRLRVSKTSASKQASKRASKRASKKVGAGLTAFILDMEEPLNEAIDAAHALRFIGYGLSAHGDDEQGRAIASLAWTACQRLDAMWEIWGRLGAPNSSRARD